MPEPMIMRYAARPERKLPKGIPSNILDGVTAIHPQTHLDVLHRIGMENWRKILELTKQSIELLGISKVLEEFSLDESSGGELSLGDSIRVAAMFIALIQNPILSAKADTLSIPDNTKIEWILKMTEKPEVMEILISRAEERKVASPKYILNEDEQTLLAWNIFHEARGEGPTGQRLVALATINRMFSPKYPASAKGVILQRMQFSWANNLLSQKNYLGKTMPSGRDEADFLAIRSEVRNFFDGKELATVQSRIIKEIANDKEITVPHNFDWTGITSYHKFGMLQMQKLAEQTKTSTQRRIERVESALEKDKVNILKYRNHIFYTEMYNK